MEHRCGVKLAGVKPVGKVNIMYEKLGMFKLLMCSVPVHLKPTDNLTWFPAESRAVLRPGCLLCLFCGFGYFFFSLLIASNLFIQECCGVPKAAPDQ